MLAAASSFANLTAEGDTVGSREDPVRGIAAPVVELHS